MFIYMICFEFERFLSKTKKRWR